MYQNIPILPKAKLHDGQSEDYAARQNKRKMLGKMQQRGENIQYAIKAVKFPIV